MNTRSVLDKADSQIEDSIGVRSNSKSPVLSPVPNAKDVGRKGDRNYGQIAIENVIPDPDQPRVEFLDEKIDQLANSLREQGQLQPIRIRWSSQHQSWLIVSGERRYRAAKKAGLPKIECYFDESNLTASQILEQQLVENLLRTDLQPIEEANAFQKLMKMNSWDGKSLAQALRISRARVSRSLALLKLPTDIQSMVADGEVSAAAAYEVSKLPAMKQRQVLSEHQSGTKTPTRAAIKKTRRTVLNRSAGTRQSFSTEKGWNVTVTYKQKGNYHEIAEALRQVLEEVELRIDNNVVLT